VAATGARLVPFAVCCTNGFTVASGACEILAGAADRSAVAACAVGTVLASHTAAPARTTFRKLNRINRISWQLDGQKALANEATIDASRAIRLA
jgi:hypothetical protein